MSAVTVRHLPTTATPEPHDAPIRIVAPEAVPDGAVVLGVVIAVPAGIPAADLPPGGGPPHGPRRELTAVPAAGGAEPATATPAEARLVPFGPGLLLDRWGRRVFSDNQELALTRREFELLEHLVSQPGRVFTRGQLLGAVWEVADTRYAPPRTVDVHVSRLRRKLGPERAVLLQSLRGVGYRWAGRTSSAAEPS